MPVENLLTPDYLRRTLWTPPRTREPGTLLDEVAAQLAAYGARSWQIGLTAPVLTRAVLEADVGRRRRRAGSESDSESDDESPGQRVAGGLTRPGPTRWASGCRSLPGPSTAAGLLVDLLGRAPSRSRTGTFRSCLEAGRDGLLELGAGVDQRVGIAWCGRCC